MATSVEARMEASFTQFVMYFLRLGCFGFGGPIALVGYMQKDLVEERHWIAQQDYLDGLAFSQLAPGPLAAQLAMYLGFVRAGFFGATIVGAAFILPSFLMVLAIGKAYVSFGGTRIISALYKRFSKNKQIRAFVQGVTAAATGAIAGAVVVLGRHSIQDYWTVAIAVVTFLILVKWKIPEPLIIGGAGLLGIAIHLR